MQPLQDRILRESKDLGRGVLKVDSFLNHQIDPDLMQEIGREFAARLGDTRPTKLMTVETGGIAPALATATVMHLPLIVARKRRAAGMPRELLSESTLSQTRGQLIDLMVSPEFLGTSDRIVIIDDFLTNAQTMLALTRLVADGGATLVGIGVVIEKGFEGGREALAELNVPVESLVCISAIRDGKIEFSES